MKSKIIRMYNLEKAVSEWAWSRDANEGIVQENIYQVGLKYKRYESERLVQYEDIVALSMRGPTKKFNRRAKVRVGIGLFDKEFEAELMEKEKGNGYRFKHTAGEISYDIEDIQRLVVPLVDDEMARAEGIDGVTNERELREYFRVRAMKAQYESESYAFIENFVGLCEYELSEKDIEELVERELNRCRSVSEKMGNVFDELTEEQLLGAVGCRSISEFKEMLRSYYKKILCAAMYAAKTEGEEEENLSAEKLFDYYVKLLNKTTELALKDYRREVCRYDGLRTRE